MLRPAHPRGGEITSDRPPVPAATRAFFLLTLLLAVVVLIASGSDLPADDDRGFWLAPLAIPVLVRTSVLVVRRTRGVELGLDSVVLLFLAFAAPDSALVLWAIGCVLSQMLSTAQPWVRVYNTGLSVLAGAAAVAVVGDVIPEALEPGPQGLLAAALGGAAYFVVDYVLSVIAIPLLGRGSLRGSLFDDTVPIAIACSGGVAALGYLGAVVLRHEGWAFPLVLVPLGALVIASQAFARADAERVRNRALFAAAAGMHTAQDEPALARVLEEQGEAALRTRVWLATEAPEDAGLVVPVAAEPPRWVAAAERSDSSEYSRSDEEALSLLASLTGDCLGRLGLMGELEEMARHDALTGLPNRATLHREIRTEAAGETHPAVLYADLDGFKHVNDRYGHEAGDALLQVVAARLRRCVRPGDLVARLGGDEFAVLLPATPAELARGIAERITEAISAPVVLDVGPVQVGISVGIAAPGTRVAAEELLRQADVAMYAAKQSGPGRAVLCTPWMREERIVSTRLAEELRGAGERGELVVHYQPVVEMATGRVGGLEALVRWQHPALGLLMPGAFIPAAEATGAVDELTTHVLAQLLLDAPALTAAAGVELLLGINVPSGSLVRGAVVDQVPSAGVSGFTLVLEVTETTLAEAQAIPVLEDLRRRRVLVAVDDLGTGHSLAALRRLPVDIVKLDGGFLIDLDSDAKAGQIVAVIARMAEVLDKLLVVEGVEQQAQVDALAAIGVELGQGYHLGRPAPLDATVSLLEERRRRVP